MNKIWSDEAIDGYLLGNFGIGCDEPEPTCQLCPEPPHSINTELCERHHFDYLDWMRFETNYGDPQMSHVAEYVEAMR